MSAALVSGLDQYRIDMAFCQAVPPTRCMLMELFKQFFSSVTYPSAYGNAKTGADVKFSLRLSIASSSFSFSIILNGCSFCNFLLGGYAMFAQFGTSHRKTLRMS